MCLYPRLIKNRKFTANKKNGGVIPPVKDNRTKMVPVACGNCMECRKAKSREWMVRLNEEIKTNTNGKFVTLSFSDESLAEIDSEIKGLTGYERDNEIARIAVRRFLERWRKKHKKSVRHWLVTELGQKKTERIHLHGLIFTDETEDIKNIWKYGHVYIGKFVNSKTINYIIKYVSKSDNLHKEYKSKMFTSKGIGSGYIKSKNAKNNKFKGNETDEMYRTPQGNKLPLPVYYRNKLYSEEEREELWINKLDKEVRYVNGKEIDISQGEEQYYKTLEYEQKRNRRLGYGDNTINWERRRYENERRNLKKKERIERLNRKRNKKTD